MLAMRRGVIVRMRGVCSMVSVGTGMVSFRTYNRRCGMELGVKAYCNQLMHVPKTISITEWRSEGRISNLVDFPINVFYKNVLAVECDLWCYFRTDSKISSNKSEWLIW